MNAFKPPAATRGQIAHQIPAFAAIGLFGYAVDAGITFIGARYLGLSPVLARPPGFIIATFFNYLLNRSITFRHAQASVSGSFLRYWVVASAGLVVNYAVYSACVALAPFVGVDVVPGILPLFVAIGSGFSMVLTFIGFRFFAFRH